MASNNEAAVGSALCERVSVVFKSLLLVFCFMLFSTSHSEYCTTVLCIEMLQNIVGNAIKEQKTTIYTALCFRDKNRRGKKFCSQVPPQYAYCLDVMN